ncbi:universal stress protein [Saccharopolyspora rhizosphaerae]|uniref:Universal stress protein n=1 Tax=Saccharopolyspora rhizosphaerae TaxID=2492662 RepID=A0A3R8P383_9PSEU|nr:universal stress protein [Saccharopolyspora rhizosphaerae]RRO18642.1 universal stress protein [Saccharopolyspora rhizosphaerae]
MNDHAAHRIVAAVDGSPPSLSALRWAVDHARDTDATITAVTAWTVPDLYDWPMPTAEQLDLATTNALREIVRGTVPEAELPRVRLHTAGGHAAEVILDCAEGADLLVVGHRGMGTFARALIGSTARYCVDHATCPVVVVRGPEATSQRQE